MKSINEENEKKENREYYQKEMIILLLIILIGLFIYDKHDEWKEEIELKKYTKDAVESLEKINNRQF